MYCCTGRSWQVPGGPRVTTVTLPWCSPLASMEASLVDKTGIAKRCAGVPSGGERVLWPLAATSAGHRVPHVDRDRPRYRRRHHPAGLDPPGPEGVEVERHLPVAGGSGEEHPLGGVEATAGRVIVDQEGVAAQLVPVPSAVACQAAL